MSPSDVSKYSPLSEPERVKVREQLEKRKEFTNYDTWYFASTIYVRKDDCTPRTVSLWVSLDEQDNIKISITVKLDRQIVTGKAEEEAAKKFVANELKINEIMSKQSPRHVPHLYGYSLLPSTNFGVVFTVTAYSYQEYAPYADLHTLMRNMESMGLGKIPEAFLWIIFRALVEAVVVMQTGKVKERPSRWALDHSKADVDVEIEKDWVPIIHRDIKPENIVLAEADDYYPAFKVPKLIDYGYAFKRDDDAFDPNKKFGTVYERAMTCGTLGYKAPEQTGKWLQAQAKKRPITGATDIFGIGTTMHTLIYCGKDDIQDLMSYEGMLECFLTGKWKGRFKDCKHYSPELIKLVKKCQAIEPSERPGLEELLRETHMGLVNYQRYQGVLEKEPEVLQYEKMEFKGGLWRVGKKMTVEELKHDAFFAPQQKEQLEKAFAASPNKKRNSNTGKKDKDKGKSGPKQASQPRSIPWPAKIQKKLRRKGKLERYR